MDLNTYLIRIMFCFILSILIGLERHITLAILNRHSLDTMILIL